MKTTRMKRMFNEKSTILNWVGWCVMLLYIGCAGRPVQAAQPKNNTLLNDVKVVDTIEQEILFDKSVMLNDINVTSSNGIVTLSGKTPSLLNKERAAEIARTVKGVRSVVNNIKIDPYWNRDDWDIAQDAEQALLYDPATDSYQVKVSVKNGKATLTGMVDSWQEKQLAETVVKGVKGVSGLDNRLTIDHDSKRLDSEIESEISSTLNWDVLVDDALINVDVNDGKVTLSGVVGSAAEKGRANIDAWVEGVSAVDDSKLAVKYWARDEKLRKKKYVTKPDNEVKKAVEAAMVYDPRVNSFNIDTSVESGVVTLHGRVDNLKAKRSAERDAKNTVGVLSVRNRIRIQTDKKLDESLEKVIRRTFLWDPYVEKYELDVDVLNGVVYLSGEVDSWFEKARADNLAAAIDGIKWVKNSIKVDSNLDYFVFNPYIYYFDPHMYDWYNYKPGHTFTPDKHIYENIKSEIWWSPFVDSDDIKVTVENGVATLSGRVNTLRERRAAIEEAYEGGAVLVRSKIEII